MASLRETSYNNGVSRRILSRFRRRREIPSAEGALEGAAMPFKKRIILTACCLLGWIVSVAVPAQDSRQLRQEESVDYFSKWLEEDVVFIISPEEKEVFQALTTPEEKEKFIEQFWKRRDPDPLTPVNEFKVEHYRRIAYANERFHTGVPGWKTDRGRIYIMYGPPDEILGKPVGGTYVRPFHEGGGNTAVFPFELWRYNYIEGIGNDVEIEFVDPHQSGEFRLARDAMEKDAMLMIPNAGLTLSEAAGFTTKTERISTRNLADQSLLDQNPFHVLRTKDTAFERLLLRAKLETAAKSVKFRDLETMVATRTTFQDLPLEFKVHFLRVSGNDILAPLTLLVANRELGFERLQSGVYRASLRLFAQLVDVTKTVVFSFEDSLKVEFSEDRLEEGQKKNSIFQRHIPLKPGRFVLKLVVQDEKSGKTSTADQLIVVPQFPDESISASSVILADAIIPERDASEEGMFSLGDFKVIPSVDYEFGPEDHVFSYFQIYNLSVDQQTLRPKFRVKRLVSKKGDFLEFQNRRPRFEFLPDGRVVVTDAVPAAQLSEGQYQFEYQIEDLISGQTLQVTSSNFKISSGS